MYNLSTNILPCIKQGDHKNRSKEVEDSRAKHHVQTAMRLLVERNAAPSRFLKDSSFILEVVHLGEEGPGGGGHEADQPDEADHLLSLSCG